jgi:hypothetical protein
MGLLLIKPAGLLLFYTGPDKALWTAAAKLPLLVRSQALMPP